MKCTMPSKAEYRQSVSRLIADNKAADFWMIHDLLHDGQFEAAERWANKIGLNTPLDEYPQFGWPLTPEQQAFLQETLDDHVLTELGLPDHEY